MSRENVEVVERMLALLHTGDADGALQRFSPLVIATQRGRGKGSGAEVATHYSTIYKVRDGQIVSMALYADSDDARAAAGLDERGG